MKIVCDACQAKYSISDDKVQGKVFKIRCKKCSNIIVVRGGAGAAEPAPAPQEKDTRVYDYGYDGGGGDQAPAADDAVWHLVINQDQVGPLTVAEVQQRFAAGEIDGETFTWREGFADWLPLSQVDTFAAYVASGSTTTASSGSGAAAVSSMFGSGDDLGGTMRSDPGDLFAAASAGSRSARDEDDGGDLFGSKPAAASAQQSASAQKLRGERNENSVLFSLNNLAQLASDSPRPAAAAASSSSAGHATGAAGGEGSGLIDIRSMASAYMGSSGGGAAVGKPASSSAIGSIDDLPVFGGGGFSEPAVIVPTARAAANNKMLYMMIAAVGLLAVVAIVMVVLLLKSDDKPTQVASATPDEKQEGDKQTDSDTPAAGSADPAADGSAAAAAAGSADAKEPEKTDEPEKADEKEPEKKEPERTASRDRNERKTPSRSERPTRTASRPDPKPEPKASDSGGCDEVSCVLNNYEGACCARYKKGGSKPSGGGGTSSKSNLPDSLDRAMISSGIAAVKARVSSCGDRSPAKGKVKVKVKVGGDGKVDSVTVETSPDASLGNCVKSAVQRASFAKTQRGGSFSYPFVF